MSACHRWNEKLVADKTWAQFKAHSSAAHRQYKKMQGISAATAGYHSDNAAVGQTEDQIAEATIGALDNLATEAAADRHVMSTLTEANVRLVKHLKDKSNELRELKGFDQDENMLKEWPTQFQSFTNQLVLDSWIQILQHSHKFELQLSKTRT
jgi:hypothetical protein